MAYAAILALLFQMASTVPETAGAGPCPADWGYGPENGPNTWGQRNAAWGLCDSGRAQSPIRIVNATQDQNLPTISVTYAAGTGYEISAQNIGQEIKFYPMAELYLNRTGLPQSTLYQFHFHFPKEHFANNADAVGELHLVHVLPDKKLVVLAVPLNRSTVANPVFQPLLALRPEPCTSKKSDGSAEQTVELRKLLPDVLNHYFSYEGSLTTPACDEIVSFIIFNNAITISDAQIAALRAMPNLQNARPLQPVGTRRVRWRQP